MCNFRRLCVLLSLGPFLLGGLLAKAQEAPDMIFFNGKIVTVDDKSFSSRIGTIAQAMAVRDGKILAIGGNSEIRRLAGSGTKLIDLRGRTVLPGLISVHEHPFDWNAVTPAIVKKVLTDDIVVTRVLEGSPEEKLKAFVPTLEEAVKKAKPGQWIYIIFTFGKQYQYSTGGNGGFGRGNPNILDGKHEPITKKKLDQIAPDNPVLLRDVFVSMMVNQRAFEQIDQVFGEAEDIRNQVDHQTGVGSANPMRWMFNDVVMRDKYEHLLEIHRLGLSWWAGYGFTTFASQAYAPSNFKVFVDLEKRGQMSLRNMWAWFWREAQFFNDQYFLNQLAARIGQGTDYFWFGGARGGEAVGGGCSSLQPRKELDPFRIRCAWNPDGRDAKLLYNWIKAGGRFAITHTVGDRDIDNLLDIIEKASKEAGLGPEEIRAKRHTFDHLVMAPRPDQLERIKRLGLVLGGNAFEIHEASRGILETYGEKAVEWVVPKKSLVEAGISSGFEIDRAIGSTDLTAFSVLAMMVHRKGWDGKVYAPNQKIDRALALKSATIWGAEYVLREKVLGSLEAGKWADFIVIDRDYLTIPEEEIERIRVLMTVVGGKVVHLVPSLAKELGMKPAGAQVELGAAAAGW